MCCEPLVEHFSYCIRVVHLCDLYVIVRICSDSGINIKVLIDHVPIVKCNIVTLLQTEVQLTHQ